MILSGGGHIIFRQCCKSILQKYVLPQHVGPEIFAVKGCLKTKSWCRCCKGRVADGGGGGLSCGGGGGGGVIICSGGGGLNGGGGDGLRSDGGGLNGGGGGGGVITCGGDDGGDGAFPSFRVHFADAALRHPFGKTSLGNRHTGLYAC
ncbi:loricrin-like [Saccostrea cucullata]|uniref:loricrin-like n=1 Tax=Saccostrea cuccullata TaxID=36930 RepID=UPI002ED1CC20